MEKEVGAARSAAVDGGVGDWRKRASCREPGARNLFASLFYKKIPLRARKMKRLARSRKKAGLQMKGSREGPHGRKKEFGYLGERRAAPRRHVFCGQSRWQQKSRGLTPTQSNNKRGKIGGGVGNSRGS